MTYQIHNSTPCRPGIPSASDYIFPISPSFKNGALLHSVPKKPPYSIGSSDMMTSQASDGVTNNGNSQYHEIAKLRISLRLLTMMALATGVSSITSLQFFLQVNWSTMIKKYVTLKEFYQTIGDIGETLDVAVLVCSCSTFFITLLQLFFVLKLQKSKNSHATIAIEYLERTSAMRLIIYSFWFLAVMLLMAAVLLLCAMNPQRGAISKAIGLPLGVIAMGFCAVVTLKSIRFWSRSTRAPPIVDNYKNFSTLV